VIYIQYTEYSKVVSRNSARISNPETESKLINLYEHPGHLLRRAQQISVSIFYDEMGSGLTPVQYAMLRNLAAHPGIDQVSLSASTGIDTSTGATVCARLEEKGLLERKVIPTNRRQRALTITAEGERLLEELIPGRSACAACSLPSPALSNCSSWNC
jgi:DNA-binding MarR family transcriptional regulator